MGICVYKDKIYTFGGTTEPGARTRYQGGSSEIKVTGANQVYDPATDTWQSKMSMLTPRADVSTVVVNNKIYVIGGYESDLKKTGITEIYDPLNDSWNIGTPAPITFSRFAAAVVNSSIYLFGSIESISMSMQTTWTAYTLIYNTESSTWSYAKPSPITLYNPGVGQTTGIAAPKAIYVISYPNKTLQYNPESDAWNTKSEMPIYSDTFGVAVIDDLIYVLGGGSAEFPALCINGQNERYNPIADETNTIPEDTASPPSPTTALTPTPSPSPIPSTIPNSPHVELPSSTVPPSQTSQMPFVDPPNSEFTAVLLGAIAVAIIVIAVLIITKKRRNQAGFDPDNKNATIT
jgi:hypothetical protein